MRTFVCLMLIVTCCTLAEGACPVGFHYYGNSCYWFSHIKGDFAEAGSICRFLGSHLVVITGASEDAFIRGYAIRTGKGKFTIPDADQRFIIFNMQLYFHMDWGFVRDFS
ncbi:perlucin-like [Haliotis rufescens]|uniref:perlucin-like n=1 Tax=Haliotis rufescens TaxID=6454 RepID=UPI00201EEDCC|nr:perlucin-like [Haliotis rufescens]